MSINKSKMKNRQARSLPGKLYKWLWRGFKAICCSKFFWKGLSITASVLVLVFLLEAMEKKLATFPEFQLDASRFSIQNKPDWMTPELEDEVLNPVRRQGTCSMFDPELSKRLAAAFGNSPWIRRVSRIEKRFPSTIELAIELRRPVAFVRKNAGYCLISEDLMVLPVEYYKLPEVVELPEITGIKSRPPREGSIWKGIEISEAVKLIRVLEEEKLIHELSIEKIDVSNFKGRRDRRASEVVLWTRTRGYIKWGNTPGRDKIFGRSSTREKLYKLNALLEQKPDLKHGGYHYIDVRFDDVTVYPRL